MTLHKEYAGPPDQCLVCGIELAGRTGVMTVEMTGDLYAFCSSECHKKFEEDPDAFIGTDEEEE